MGYNEIKATLSIVSLLTLVIAAVCWFSKAQDTAIILVIVAVVCKLAEVIIRFCVKRKK